MSYSFEEVKEKMECAISKLVKNDFYLLEMDANERSITHKLAEYLQQEFPDYDVDCEYNRHMGVQKYLKVPEENVGWDDAEAKTVFPDIIIHNRGNDEDNLLIIETKKSSSNIGEDFDKDKIAAFMDGEYFYQFGLFIKFYVGDESDKEPSLEWYENEGN